MEELSHKLNTLLEANDYPVLYEYKTYLKQKAEAHVRSELAAYKTRIAAPKETKALPAPKRPTQRSRSLALAFTHTDLDGHYPQLCHSQSTV